MATLGSYYIDSSAFNTATGVYTDANLSILAPDGWYQSCGTYRRQLLGVLQAPELCALCNTTECGTNPSGGFLVSGTGKFDLSVNLGTATGSWKVAFSPGEIPKKISVSYSSGTTVNGSSSVYGFLAGPYFGRTSVATANGFPVNSPFSVVTREWDGTVNGANQGTNFVSTGTSSLETATAGDFSGTVLDPGVINLFIPKTVAEPQTATISIISPVGGTTTSFGLSNNCPANLTGFSASSMRGDFTSACSEARTNTFYNGVVNGVAGQPALHDVIFIDNESATTLAEAGGGGAGFYSYADGVNPVGWFEIDINSVIVNIGACPP